MEKRRDCTHCGQEVKEAVWNADQSAVYCCFGCKVVDEMIRQRGNPLEQAQLKTDKYAYLNEETIQQKLIDFKDEKYTRITLHLPQIHCSSCIYLLENLSEIEEGITNVQVNFSKKQAAITFRQEQIALAKLAALLDYIHYAPDFKTNTKTKTKSNKHLLLQLGVAGFFFGNTMLLAFPDYFGNSLSLTPELQQFFRYLMMGFSIPVILFSGRDYFLNAAKSLRAGFLSIDLPIALGITVLFLRSSYEVFSATGNGYFDSLNGLIFFLLVGKWYQQKTYQNFAFDRDFRSFMPLSAQILLKDGREKAISIDNLEAGDTIITRHNEVIPTDVYLESEQADVDYSYITGESLPVAKERGELIFAGGRVLGQSIQLQVKNKPDRSYLASLWQNQAFSESEHKVQRKFTDKVSQYFTPTIILIALSAGVAWSFHDIGQAVQVFTAVLIVACPCALALAEPFANGSLMRWFGRKGFYLKSSDVASSLVQIKHIVFDKTGTLTQADQIEAQWHGAPLAPNETAALREVLQNSTHPLSEPILKELHATEAAPYPLEDYREVPGQGVEASVGAHKIRLGKAGFVQSEETSPLPGSYLEVDGMVKGYFSFTQKPRHQVAKMLQRLREVFKLSLLSGDTKAAAAQFRPLFGEAAQLKFEASPHQKLDYIKELESCEGATCMIGDGLNDAGALQQSSVGISLCEKNVNYFPASDALLMADKLEQLPQFFELARKNRQVISIAFVISFLYNLVGISFAASGLLSPLIAAILMPISSVTIVVFTTLSNGWLAHKILQDKT